MLPLPRVLAPNARLGEHVIALGRHDGLDRVLAPLRGTPSFRELEARMEAGVARMRAHALASSPLMRRITAEKGAG